MRAPLPGLWRGRHRLASCHDVSRRGGAGSVPRRYRCHPAWAPRWPADAFPHPGDQGDRLHGLVVVRGDGRKTFLPGSVPAFSARAPVYTDGSGLHPATPYAVASGAAVQALPAGAWPASAAGATAVFAVVGAVVPRHAPATSYGGEVVGMLLAARCAQDGDPLGDAPVPRVAPEASLRLVTDCLSVVRRMAQLRTRPLCERDAWAGFYRGIGRALLGRQWEVSKTRAHRTRDQAVADGDVADWLGNDVSDWVAGHTLAAADRAHRAGRAAAADAARAHRAGLAAVVRRILAVRARVGVPPAAPRRVPDGLRAARFALPEAERHAFRWEPDRHRYQCLHCRRLVVRLPRPGNRCLRAHPGSWPYGRWPWRWHSVHLCAIKGRLAGILALCAMCCAYGEERCHRLRRPCPGELSFRAFSVRAIARGRHPHCRASFVERVWALDAAAGAPAPPAGAAEPPAEPPPGPLVEPGAGPPALLAVPADLAGEGDWPIEDLLAWHGGGLDGGV